MTIMSQRRIALSGAILSGLTVIACLAVLARGYWVASAETQPNAQRVVELKAKVETDAAFAPVLADELARQSTALRARKATNESVAIVLIASAALFIACAKWLAIMRGRNAPPIEKLIQIRISRELAQTGARTKKREARTKPPTHALSDETIDLTFVDELVARLGDKKEAAIPILQAIQSRFRYLPDEALRRVCELTEITPSQIAGTSSFYAQFRRSPVGAHIVRVCHGTACHVAGARQITDELRRHLEIPEGADTDPERMFTVDEVACLGCCSLAPVLMVDDHTSGKLTPTSARESLQIVAQEALA